MELSGTATERFLMKVFLANSSIGLEGLEELSFFGSIRRLDVQGIALSIDVTLARG